MKLDFLQPGVIITVRGIYQNDPEQKAVFHGFGLSGFKPPYFPESAALVTFEGSKGVEAIAIRRIILEGDI